MDRITCHRCRGLMQPIDPLDPMDLIQGGKLDAIRAWRCLTCGELIDPVIMQNRRLQDERGLRRRKSRPRQPLFQEREWERPIWR